MDFTQKQCADLLFGLYPDIEKAYRLSQKLTGIFNQTKDKLYAYAELARWHEEVNLARHQILQYNIKTIIKPLQNYPE